MALTRITSNVIENGTIIDADISATAAISMSKLQPYIATTKTVYIAPRTDGIAGDGTITNPYDAGGATEQIAAEKYDNIIKDRTKCPNFCLINLMPGRFFTRGANEYQVGRPNSQYNYSFRADYPLACSVKGSGAGVTFLKIVAGPTPTVSPVKYNGIIIWAEVEGSPANSKTFYQKPITLEGISLDGNWQVLREQNKAVCGLSVVAGSTLGTIKDCHCYNFGGDWNTGSESFVISATAYNGLALIENCITTNEVDSWDGAQPYCSAIGAGGNISIIPTTGFPYQQIEFEGTAIVRNCMVIGGTANHAYTGPSGCTATGNRYAEVSNCVVIKKNSGFYRDTGISKINIIKGNTYYDCEFGVHGNFNNTEMTYKYSHDNNWIITDNVFWLRSDQPYNGACRIIGSLKVHFKRNIINGINLTGSFAGCLSRIQGTTQVEIDENQFEAENISPFELAGLNGPVIRGEDRLFDGTVLDSTYVPMLWGQSGAGVNPGLVTITRNGSVATATVVNPSQTALPRYVEEYKPVYRIAGANQPEYNGIHRITITSNTTFTFPIEGTPASPATGTILSYVCIYSCSKDFYIQANHPDPLENGKKLDQAMKFCAQIQEFNGTVDFIANIYLGPGYYKFENRTGSYYYGKFNIIGLGNADNTIIDFGTQLADANRGFGFHSIGSNGNTRFSFKNCTITGSKSAAVGAGVTSQLISVVNNDFKNSYENVIFDKGTHDVITLGGLQGIFRNCTINGQVNTFNNANTSCVGKFYNCNFQSTFLYALQLQSVFISEFNNCNFELVSGANESDILMEGIISNCKFKCSRATKSRLSVSENYFTTIRDTKLDNIDLRISVGNQLPANPALRAEIYNTQIILPTGTTPAIVSQNANTNIRVSALTTNGASPYKDTNTVVQTLSTIS
jgi:hypothetical protein